MSGDGAVMADTLRWLNAMSAGLAVVAKELMSIEIWWWWQEGRERKEKRM